MFEPGDRVRFADPLSSGAIVEGVFVRPEHVPASLDGTAGQPDAAWVARPDGTPAYVPLAVGGCRVGVGTSLATAAPGPRQAALLGRRAGRLARSILVPVRSS